MRAARLVLTARWGGFAIALAFFVVWGSAAARLDFLHDEGLMTFDPAAALPHAFLPLIFFLRAKAILTLLYALPARAGIAVYLVAHAAVAAGAVVLVTEAARRWQLPSPNLAGWMLATSVGFGVAAGSGFTTSDGAFFLALFLWLYAGERRVAAAVVLGALPFVRHELAFAMAIIGACDLWRRRDARFVMAALAFPVAYIVLGAIYHHDLLWPLHSLPNTAEPQGIRRYQVPNLPALLLFVLSSLLVNFSALGIVGLVGWDKRDRRLWPLFVVAVSTYALLIAFAGSHTWFGVDRSLRYHVAPLPLVAVLVASWRGRDAIGELIVAMQTLGLAVVLAATNFGREQRGRDQRLMQAVRASGWWHGQPIYTDVQILRVDRCVGADAWMLANDSMLYELDRVLAVNPAQRRAVLAALAQQRWIIAPGPPRRDALYLIDGSEHGRRWREYVEATHPAALRIDDYWLYAWR